MKNLFLIISLLITSIISAQTGSTIEGVVTDASAANEPMLFANVTIRETNQSLTTGFRGGYFFKNLKPGTYTLEFNFLGYETVVKTVKIKEDSKRVDATLQPSTDIKFDEVQLTSK